MPAGRIDQTLYIGTGSNVEAINVATLYKPGELGSQFQTVNGKGYQLIQVDSGATAAGSIAGHAPQAGDVAFWRDKTKYTVTNSRSDAGSPGAGGGGGATNSRNLVAGVFCSVSGGASGTASITPGNYGVIQQRGQHPGVLTSGNTLATGLYIQCSSSATAPDGSNVVITNAPVGSFIGIATAANGAVTATYTPATLGGYDLVDTP